MLKPTTRASALAPEAAQTRLLEEEPPAGRARDTFPYQHSKASMVESRTGVGKLRRSWYAQHDAARRFVHNSAEPRDVVWNLPCRRSRCKAALIQQRREESEFESK